MGQVKVAGRFSALIFTVIAFSLVSPLMFDRLGLNYFNQLKTAFPPGSSSFAATTTMTHDGLDVGVEERVCNFHGDNPCYRFLDDVIYAGGNPLCSYWKSIKAITVSRRFAVNDVRTEIDRWEIAQRPATCFWRPGSSAGRLAILIGSIRAELGIR